MENEAIRERLTFLNQLREFVQDYDAFGRMQADLHDLVEASSWLLQTLDKNRGRILSVSELEDLLLEIEIHFIRHSLFHLASFRKDVKATLENFPDSGVNSAP